VLFSRSEIMSEQEKSDESIFQGLIALSFSPNKRFQALLSDVIIFAPVIESESKSCSIRMSLFHSMSKIDLYEQVLTPAPMNVL